MVALNLQLRQFFGGGVGWFAPLTPSPSSSCDIPPAATGTLQYFPHAIPSAPFRPLPQIAQTHGPARCPWPAAGSAPWPAVCSCHPSPPYSPARQYPPCTASGTDPVAPATAAPLNNARTTVHRPT